MQEKYGRPANYNSGNTVLNGSIEDWSITSTDSEEEDEEGMLASERLDAQIQDTLDAIRKKDPRVYDQSVRFFSSFDEEQGMPDATRSKSPKPMFLSDYHQKILLDTNRSLGEARASSPTTYTQQQNDLKEHLVKEMHATADHIDSNESEGAEGGENTFLVAKSNIQERDNPGAPVQVKLDYLDIKNADLDPDTYLSKFMSNKAWIPLEGSRFQPFESDDEEDDRRAEEFEEAYNLRFEDPTKSNEKLMSHARDTVARHSVRKEKLNPRRRARETERDKKKVAKQILENERARLRKLKVDEAEEKLQKFKEAAGIYGTSFDQDDWLAFLEEGWDDSQWEQQMKKRFGDDYYADQDDDVQAEDQVKKPRPKKPKWEEDIDIKDIIPDFADGEENNHQQFDLTADLDSGNEGGFSDTLSQNDLNKERKQTKKEARQRRRNIEQMIDKNIHIEETLSHFGRKHTGNFRYRETSPLAFGLTAQDILLASDSQLNQYAGLKKLATFRDMDKKRRDQNRFSKKARLRQWRKDTFGGKVGLIENLAQVIEGIERNDGYSNAQTMTQGSLEDEKRKGRKKRPKGK